MAHKIADRWMWDSWYAKDGDTFHGYFLQAPKSLIDPDLRHMNATQRHAVSKDLVNWTDLGTSFEPQRNGPAWDDSTTWTGSVVQDDAGLWHLFYTGTRKSERSLYQRIGHATSSDLHNWTRVGTGLCLDLTGPNAGCYEIDHKDSGWHDRALRDPWVMKDPEGHGWLMYFTARVPGVPELNAGGAVGFATSPDLMTWTLQPPVFHGGFGQLEVPQVFQLGQRWYCLFCTAAGHWSEQYRRDNPETPLTGSHYLISDHPRGPWRIAPGPFLDGAEPCRRYAARIVEGPQGLVILGFADGGKDHFGGYVMDPEAITVNPAGLLHVAPLLQAAE
ncbi:glycoside hydrolase family protein [Tabrizicola oligotrophica]|uniref:Levansucrase n=1 Tax=Tabrizicola oligotrophica TaxID=2710650 RepID=A0A6M0QRA2_9RHOB|nr:levansucrase [Tabrizicola oligotrophica]NEY89314.1 levansucrase [Tabrizicola oligotrophica]